MKKYFYILFLLIFSISIFPQPMYLLNNSDLVQVPSIYQDKILSGELLMKVSEKLYAKRNHLSIDNPGYSIVIIYFDKYPSTEQLDALKQLEIKYYPETWTPPLENHPYGFMIAMIPIEKFVDALSLPFVLKMDTGERQSYPMNNEAVRKTKTDSVWLKGYTGTGIKVAILDSGCDTEPTHSDLPATIQKRDYSNYPTSIDDNVENTVSGHGTHVTGSVLGRGVLSTGNIGNGGSPYKGTAPNASLVFLKIGSDATSGASSSAMIASMHAAVDTFGANLLSMSYGGWYAYHDGSSSEEQTVDWVYASGKPFLLSAGNEGASNRHYSGTVAGGSTTDFIQVNVTGAGTTTALYFNLVWADGIGTRNGLTLSYYNSSYTLLTNTTIFTTTESPRGTESQYSYYNVYVPSGNSTFYLKVTNPSGTSQDFHIYETWNDGKVKFNSPDPFYTIGQPSSADNGFSVGAWTSRSSWTDYSGSFWTYGFTQDDIAPFSSRGPRIDGTIMPKIASPGSVIISIRDRDVYTSTSAFWVDNDGTIGSGGTDYYVMQGTSMATPICAGCVALMLNKMPTATPLQIYNALKNNTDATGFMSTLPNNTWGYGKLNVNKAIEDAALPVELVSFNAVLQNKMILLKWITANEVNSYGFEIEKSVDNVNWTKIGFVNANGNSNSRKNYSFLDFSINGEKIHYRLKQIDNDGNFSLSNIVSVETSITEFTLEQNFPNPFNNQTKIKYSVPIQSKVQLIVMNMLGETVKEIVNDEQNPGNYEINFSTNDLSSGIYFYKLTANNFSSIKKFILLK